MGERLVRLQPDYSLFFYLCWVSSFLPTLVYVANQVAVVLIQRIIRSIPAYLRAGIADGSGTGGFTALLKRFISIIARNKRCLAPDGINIIHLNAAVGGLLESHMLVGIKNILAVSLMVSSVTERNDIRLYFARISSCPSISSCVGNVLPERVSVGSNCPCRIARG